MGILLGDNFLPMFGAKAAYTWTGATWALTGGRAYNTPTLGSELLTNIGFDTDLTSWISVPGAGGGTITWSAGAALFTQGSSANMYLAQSRATTVGAWLQFSEDVVAMSSANNTRAGIGSSATVRDIAQGNFAGGVRTNTVAGRATTTPVYAIIQDSQGSSATSNRDNATMKQLTLATLFATQVSGANGLSVSAKPYAINGGTPAGVVSHLDSAASPANFIIAYHDGATSIKMDKCVGGTYSNLVSATAAFASDAVIEIRSTGSNHFECWYGGSKRGLTATVSDAGIISNTRYGLFSTYSANQFSDGLTLDGVLIPFAF